jgi:hypothetical protein
MVKRSGWFKFKYCNWETGGGGATRFKEHLAHKVKDVKDCPSVPPDVKQYFIAELERIKEKRLERDRARLRPRSVRDFWVKSYCSTFRCYLTNNVQS